MGSSRQNLEVKQFVAVPLVMEFSKGSKKTTIKLAKVLQIFESNGVTNLQI